MYSTYTFISTNGIYLGIYLFSLRFNENRQRGASFWRKIFHSPTSAERKKALKFTARHKYAYYCYLHTFKK